MAEQRAAPRIGTRAEWLAERAALLEREKAHTRARAQLAEERRALPWVPVEQDYRFEGADGPSTLRELFGDASQLAIYHFMFGDGWDAPCPGCTQWADALDNTTHNFAMADARLVVVSRGPIAQLLAERERRGWRFDWYSSAGSTFNEDFHVSADVETTEAFLGEEKVGFDRGENHGVSVFALHEDAVYHCYSVYNRGIEAMNGAFGYYDLLPHGRPW